MGKFRWYKTPAEQRKGESSSSFMGYTLFKGVVPEAGVKDKNPSNRYREM